MDTATVINLIGIAISTVIALWALFFSHRANQSTKKYNKEQIALQKQVNDLSIEREQRDKQEAKKADLMAILLKQDQTHRVEIVNQGRAAARNVRIETSEEDPWCLKSMMADKFPMDILQPQQKVDFPAVVVSGTGLKNKIVLRWEDGFSKDNEKPVNLTC